MSVSATIEVVVTGMERQTERVTSFELEAVSGKLPDFAAGAHVDVHLGDGLMRQYSLCGDPDRPERYEIAVLLEPASRGGSSAMHALRPGARLRIGAPRNQFPLREDAGHSLLVAGGIGITPMLAMGQRLHRLGRSFELHGCARGPDRAPFRDRLSRSGFADRVRWHYSGDPAGGRLVPDALLDAASPDTQLYVCGPAGLIDAMLAAAGRLGWDEARLHHERFAASAGGLDTAGDRPFEILVRSLGRTLAVPVGRTALQVLHEHGVDVPVSCEQGMCGTCLVPVVEGVPDHRDTYLTDEERAANDQFTACCSRAKSARLVLDV